MHGARLQSHKIVQRVLRKIAATRLGHNPEILTIIGNEYEVFIGRNWFICAFHLPIGGCPNRVFANIFKLRCLSSCFVIVTVPDAIKRFYEKNGITS